MLFDLRARGRRRTVQVVYLGLAVLMGGGLVLFGVGAGNGNGGLLNAFSGGSSSQKTVVSQGEKTALRQTQLNPNDPNGWSALLQARWTSAQQEGAQTTTGVTYTAQGKHELAGAAQAWQRYVVLIKHPDPTLAILAARAYQAMGSYA